MLFSDHLIVVRGGGDLATGVIYRLHKAGFPIIVLELERPLVIRRRVAVATAVFEKHLILEKNMYVQHARNFQEAIELVQIGVIPVVVAPEFPDYPLTMTAVVDARLAKRNIDTTMEQAPFVAALGPGFTAGEDCHAVVETMRGHSLGRVIWRGAALPNTGTPGIVAGKGGERVLRAPQAGTVNWRAEIGDLVEEEDRLGDVDGAEVVAPFGGVVRGLIANETAVTPNLKIGDIDARADKSACFTISDKALSIGGGVLEAILTHLNRN